MPESEGDRARLQSELARAVGWVAMLGGELEASLRHLFIIMLKTSARGAPFILSAGQDAGWLVDYCQRLAEAAEMPDPGLARFKECLSEARQAYNLRSDIIHATWFQDAESDVLHRRNSKRARSAGQMESRGVKVEAMSVEEVNDAAERVAVAIDLVAEAFNLILEDWPRREDGGRAGPWGSGRISRRSRESGAGMPGP